MNIDNKQKGTNKMKAKIILAFIFILTVLIIAVTYGGALFLLGSLIHWSGDPQVWHPVTRGILGVMGFAILLLNAMSAWRVVKEKAELLESKKSL